MRALLLVLLLLPAPAAAQQRIERRWPVDPDVSFRITSSVGTIRVRGWDRDTVAVIAEIPAGAGGFYGGASGRAGKMGIERSEQSRAPGATLDVRVPRGTRLWIKTVSAPVEVSGVDGELDLYAVTGPIRVSGTPRVVTAEALDGAITADLGDGIARLRTGAGAIRVTASGGDVTAISVEGLVALNAPALARGRLESVSGGVRFAGNLSAGGALDVETHGGDAVLRFAGPLNAEFALTAVAGAIRDELGGGGSPVKGKPLRFTLGNGAAEVTVRSFKGTITVGR